MVVMAEGLGTTLEPRLRLAEVMAPYARRLMLERYSPAVCAELLGESGRTWPGCLLAPPARSSTWLDELDRGGFEVGVRGADVERVLSRLEALVNRVVLASGFIMGLAALMAVYHSPDWQAGQGLPSASASCGRASSASTWPGSSSDRDEAEREEPGMDAHNMDTRPCRVGRSVRLDHGTEV